MVCQQPPAARRNDSRNWIGASPPGCDDTVTTWTDGRSAPTSSGSGCSRWFEHTSATSIIAETVYFGDADSTARLLGLWEAAIGVCLIFHPLARVAIALLAIRLPGTLLALAVRSDICWTDTALVPTIQGQYLIKDTILLTAAMVIGGGLRRDHVSSEASSVGASSSLLEEDGPAGDIDEQEDRATAAPVLAATPEEEGHDRGGPGGDE